MELFFKILESRSLAALKSEDDKFFVVFEVVGVLKSLNNEVIFEVFLVLKSSKFSKSLKFLKPLRSLKSLPSWKEK